MIAHSEHKAGEGKGGGLCSLSLKMIQANAPRFMREPPIAVDGTMIENSLHKALESGNFNQVPVLAGTTKDENRFFVGLTEQRTGKALTSSQYPTRVKKNYGRNASKVLNQYQPADYNSPSLAYSAIGTDYSVCYALSTDRLLSRFVPVYLYEFADRTAPSYIPPASIPYGAYHTSELQYLFPQYHGARGTPHSLNKAQRALSADMVDYWTTFAKNGDPNSPATPHWPRYNSAAGKYQSLNRSRPETKRISALRADHHCAFWDALR